MGAIRMILDFTHLQPRCGEEDTRPSIIAKVHYMYFALILFWITVITIVVISLFTEPMKEGNVSKTNTYIMLLCDFRFLYEAIEYLFLPTPSVTDFPKLGTHCAAFVFSRAYRLARIFPRLPLVDHFPAPITGHVLFPFVQIGSLCFC